MRQQRHRTREAGHDVQHPLELQLQVQHGELAHGVALAEQHFHHQVRAAVGGAQHDKTRAFAADEALPELRVPGRHGPHHQPAHAVRQDAHRQLGAVAGLPPRFGLIEGLVQQRGQLVGRGRQRPAPVVGEGQHPVALVLQVLAEVAVGAVEELVRLGGIGRPAVPLALVADLLQALVHQLQRVEPDALPTHRQVGAHDAGQHDHHRPAVGAGTLATLTAVTAVRRCAAVGGCAAIGQETRPDGFELGHLLRLCGGGEPAGQSAARFGIGKVVEVTDLRTFDELACRLAAAGHAGGHGIGVHHQVVAFAAEGHPVGQQLGQPPEARCTFHVTGDHAQPQAGLRRRAVQQPGHRRAGQHGFQPRHAVGVGAAACHLQRDALEGMEQRADLQRRNQPDQRQQAGQEQVDVARGQPGAAHRCGHPHIAAHLPAAAAPFRGQGMEAGAVAPVGVLQVVGVERQVAVQEAFIGLDPLLVALGVRPVQRHQVADDATARVGHQVDLGAGREHARQRQGVFDRAFGEGAVLQRQDARAVAGLQARPVQPGCLRCAAQVGKAALGAGRRAVDEHQQRALGRIGGQLGRGQRQQGGGRIAAAHPAVQAGGAVELSLDGPHQRARGQVTGAPGGAVPELVGQRFLTPFPQVLQGGVDDAVRAAGAQQEDPGHQAPQAFQQPTGGVGRRAAQLVQVEAAMGAGVAVLRGRQCLRPHLLQCLLQPLAAGVERRAVRQLQHQQLAGRHGHRLLAATGCIARAAAQVPGAQHLQVVRRQETLRRSVRCSCGRAARGAAQLCRPLVGIDGLAAKGQGERGCLLRCGGLCHVFLLFGSGKLPTAAGCGVPSRRLNCVARLGGPAAPR